MNGIVVGRNVHYVIGAQDKQNILNRRERLQVYGNDPEVGDHVAMMIVKVSCDEQRAGVPLVNGRCFLDGNDFLWVISVPYDENKKPGTWHWIEKA